MSEMPSVAIHPLPISSLVHIVNEWGDVPRTAAHEGTAPYPPMEALRTDHPEFWRHMPQVDEASLIEVANLVYPVFASASGAECAGHLNRLLAETGMTPALVSCGRSVHEVWRAPMPGRELLAAAVLSLIEHLRREPDASRLGTCEGDACADVYVDQSPGGRRHYCSLTCQNRARARAYRARRRATARG